MFILISLYFFLLSVVVVKEDILKLKIPNRVNQGFFIGLIMVLLMGNIQWKLALFGIIMVMVVFILLYIISNKGVGEGDLKLLFSLSGILGIKGSVFFLILMSSLPIPVVIVLKVIKKDRKQLLLPFGPFIIVSFQVVYWYLSLESSSNWTSFFI